eukprot:scaffold713_cov114-Isochrysis_galbana.AAC.6
MLQHVSKRPRSHHRDSPARGCLRKASHRSEARGEGAVPDKTCACGDAGGTEPCHGYRGLDESRRGLDGGGGGLPEKDRNGALPWLYRGETAEVGRDQASAAQPIDQAEADERPFHHEPMQLAVSPCASRLGIGCRGCGEPGQPLGSAIGGEERQRGGGVEGGGAHAPIGRRTAAEERGSLRLPRPPVNTAAAAIGRRWRRRQRAD